MAPDLGRAFGLSEGPLSTFEPGEQHSAIYHCISRAAL